MLENITYDELYKEFKAQWRPECDVNPGVDRSIIISPNNALSLNGVLIIYNLANPPLSRASAYIFVEGNNRFVQLKIDRERGLLLINDLMAIKYA